MVLLKESEEVIMQRQLFKVYIHMVYGDDVVLYKYLVAGSKKDLYAFIGFKYSCNLLRINRISYEIVNTTTDILEFDKYCTISEDGHLQLYEKDIKRGL